MDAKELVERGRRARALLETDIFREACETVERNYILQWRKATAVEERELAHARITALTDVVRNIHLVMERGAHEAALQQKQQ
jgi:hypothetical protein